MRDIKTKTMSTGENGRWVIEIKWDQTYCELALYDRLLPHNTPLMQLFEVEAMHMIRNLIDAGAREIVNDRRQSTIIPAQFEPLSDPTPESEIAIWWLNGHSENDAIIDDGDIERLPEYLAGEVYSLHGRPTRGRLWVPEEIQINEIKWDDTKPRAKDCADRGGIVFWRKDLSFLKGLPGFVTDTQMNEISLQ